MIDTSQIEIQFPPHDGVFSASRDGRYVSNHVLTAPDDTHVGTLSVLNR